MEYMPEIYLSFQKRFPAIHDAYHELSRRIHQHGPLDQKSAHLIKLAVAIGMNSEGAIRSHARRALQEGASRDEIYHAVLLSFTTCGFPYTSAALKWVDEVMEKEGKA